MTTQLTSEHHIIEELLGPWPTVCHGFSNEYFGAAPGVNQDGTAWLIFHYDYSDEVGPSTYPGLAVPAVKIFKEATRALQSQPDQRIKLSVAAIPVEARRSGSLDDPLIPSIRSVWKLSIVLHEDSHVAACIAHGTEFECKFNEFHTEKETKKLAITLDSLAAVHISIDPWQNYVPRNSAKRAEVEL